MNKEKVKKFIDEWLLPKKVKIHAQIIRDKIKNRLKYGTKDFEKNKLLHNIHISDRCFVVGTGPSINQQDLTKLKDEIVIGISGLYSHKDIIVIDPRYYVMSPVFRSHSDLYPEDVFIERFRAMDKALSDDTVMFLDIGDKLYVDKYKLFSQKKVYWTNYISWDEEAIETIDLSAIPQVKTVSEVALTVALYLGFEKIYMMGFDHDWFNGRNVYFDQAENKKFFSQKNSDKESAFGSIHQMTSHATMFKKYEYFYNLKHNIYNTNADLDSYVDTFPKVKYKELFE